MLSRSIFLLLPPASHFTCPPPSPSPSLQRSCFPLSANTNLGNSDSDSIVPSCDLNLQTTSVGELLSVVNGPGRGEKWLSKGVAVMTLDEARQLKASAHRDTGLLRSLLHLLFPCREPLTVRVRVRVRVTQIGLAQTLRAQEPHARSLRRAAVGRAGGL